MENLDKVRCPEWKEKVKPLNFGFYNCKYEIEFYLYNRYGSYKDKVNGYSGNKEFKIFEEYSKVDGNYDYLVFNITWND